MKAFLVTVLSAIAAGVLLIAYGLLSPRAAAATSGAPPDLSGMNAPVLYDPQTGTYQLARPIYASQRMSLPVAYAPAPIGSTQVRVVDERTAKPAPTRTAFVRAGVERAHSRDWRKTALVIGGSTVSGAGLGAIVAGKKGALVGAALAGGASTLWEALRR
jgi:hypothetical protein